MASTTHAMPRWTSKSTHAQTSRDFAFVVKMNHVEFDPRNKLPEMMWFRRREVSVVEWTVRCTPKEGHRHETPKGWIPATIEEDPIIPSRRRKRNDRLRPFLHSERRCFVTLEQSTFYMSANRNKMGRKSSLLGFKYTNHRICLGLHLRRKLDACAAVTNHHKMALRFTRVYLDLDCIYHSRRINLLRVEAP